MASVTPADELKPAPGAAPDEPPVDPHGSKIAPDDPRLRLGRARGRTLRRGPALGLVLSLLGVILVSMVVAFEPSSKNASAKKADGPEVTPAATAPVVPDTIRYAPDKPPLVGPPVQLSVRGPDGGTLFGEGPATELSRGNRPNGAESHGANNVPDRSRQLAEEQDNKARGSGVLFEVGGGAMGGASSPGAAGRMATESGKTSASPSSSSPAAGTDDPNLQERKNAFLDQAGALKTRSHLDARVQKPLSPYEIKAGSIIPAVLLTAINSDLPGPVIGQVRENVYDTLTGNYLLVPQGSRLLATYDSMVAWGQERVLVCWNRLIFPNGDSITLECMPAADLDGRAGLTDDVNEHWGRLIKGAAVASLLAATTEAVAGNTQGFSPTVPQMWARSAGGEVNQVGQHLTARNLNIQPTITVRPGYSVNVMVTKDLIVPPYRQVIPGLGAPLTRPKPW